MAAILRTSDKAALNYFVCTLGQARDFPATPWSTVRELLEYQASHIPHRPAVGFLDPDPSNPDGTWAWRVLSEHTLDPCNSSQSNPRVAFDELRRKAIGAGNALLSTIIKYDCKTIGLLGPSTPKFWLVWLGLCHMGYTVLLIASVTGSLPSKTPNLMLWCQTPTRACSCCRFV